MATTETRRYREQSRLTELYTDADGGGPYTIHFDQWFTRRKRFHVITDKHGAVLFRSRWVADLQDWLDSRDQLHYQAIIGERRFVVLLTPIGSKKGPPA